AAVPLIAGAFPDAVAGGKVDRGRLADQVARDPEALARLEALVHPLVQNQQQTFIEAARNSGHAFAVLDIPLLFETGRDRHVDAVVVASAPEAVQKARVLARPLMTQEKFAAILARQLPDSDKRRRADFVVDTSTGLEEAFEQVRAIAAQLEGRGKS
ncbi:MAG TPA: dephospho-CoA kinase, partial [Aestuariivirgaceae bacterium]|nr:dephospho-CoA kinase [Aestuariivirgaceae bacterium]